MSRVNVTSSGRAASILAGAALLYMGRRHTFGMNGTATTAGLALISRGITGWCPVLATKSRYSSSGPNQTLGPNFGLS